jgi:hypothetical protein
MMLIFLSFVGAIPSACVASLATPPHVKDMSLEFALIVTRHGARTPQTAYLPAM